MKRTFFIIAALANITFFIGCSKSDNGTLLPKNDVFVTNANGVPASANPNSATAETYGVTYQLLAVLPPDPLIKWNSGTITGSELVFDGYQQWGSSLHDARYEVATGRVFNLIAPTNLGKITVAEGRFYAMDLTMVLGGANLSPSFYLLGNFSNAIGINVPVEVIIYDKLKMTGRWTGDVWILANQHYTGTLILNMAEITLGITTQMLVNAERKNGVIKISPDSNGNLYRLILDNLQNPLRADFH